MAGDNFTTRCLAALAGNGAVLLATANFVGAHLTDFKMAPWLAGGVMIPPFVGVMLAYYALGRETAKPAIAKRCLQWSLFSFTANIAGLIAALIFAPAKP
jgi:hypothetical protein